LNLQARPSRFGGFWTRREASLVANRTWLFSTAPIASITRRRQCCPLHRTGTEEKPAAVPIPLLRRIRKFRRQRRQKCLNFRLTLVFWVAHSMEEDVSFHSLHIRLLSTNVVVLYTQKIKGSEGELI
jgi:hypothetical protein